MNCEHTNFLKFRLNQSGIRWCTDCGAIERAPREDDKAVFTGAWILPGSATKDDIYKVINF